MALLDDFTARFPEIDNGAATRLVPIYEPVWSCYYGGDYENDCDKNIILLLLAHLITVDPSVSGSGSKKSVASKSVGSVSVSYDAVANMTGRDVAFSSTWYGQQYLLLTSQNAGPMFL